MPAAARAPINGFALSSRGLNMQYALTGATCKFKAIQSRNAAVYLKPRFRPSYGAGFGIATLVGQFIFTIVFGIKTNWAAAAASESTSDSLPWRRCNFHYSFFLVHFFHFSQSVNVRNLPSFHFSRIRFASKMSEIEFLTLRCCTEKNHFICFY